MPAVQNLNSEADLEEMLSEPYPDDVDFAQNLTGDVLVLGAGGKLGPTLIRRIQKARLQAGNDGRVYAVSRWSDARSRQRITDAGAEPIDADLLEQGGLSSLPDVPNVIYLVGMKFGSTGREAATWAVNTFLPGLVAERFKTSRIVALSTGNVYPLVRPETGGSKELDPPDPVGEYAQSCLGRERIFTYFSEKNDTPVCLLRLNYAVEPRYGVLVDIARRVLDGEPVPLGMGYVNCVWQGYANSVCFRALGACTSPPHVLNLTGPEILSVREVAEWFGKRFERPVRFAEEPGERALLNDAHRCHELFGKPDRTAYDVMELTASWLQRGGRTLDKPTHFEVRNGRF